MGVVIDVKVRSVYITTVNILGGVLTHACPILHKGQIIEYGISSFTYGWQFTFIVSKKHVIMGRSGRHSAIKTAYFQLLYRRANLILTL